MSLFRLCGRLSLRQMELRAAKAHKKQSLPLMRKTFIEAAHTASPTVSIHVSLPLMRKTFIEAWSSQSLTGRVHPVFSAYAEDFH